MLIQILPEIGLYAMILALAMALVQAIVPLAGSVTRRALWMSYAGPMAWGQALFLLVAFVCLALGFLFNDFSVAYIANNANSNLPWYYRLSAVWGGHEGSVLLWSMMMAFWGLAVSLFSRNLPRDMLARVLSVLGMINAGFLLFILVTSSPFERILPVPPLDGADLNPLLQDPGLIVHPPMLYMGYVGFSVAFAFALAALMGGRLDAAWTRWARPWTNLAWAFLSVGIALGSWWAYYELGWGGWWFWDPVENASLMPWLAGTALMHSLAVTEKRGGFKSWTVLLAIVTFSLSLLGTFLVRSGVLTSVHAFANDPSRGTFILILLGLTVGGSLALYALRAPRVKSPLGFGWLSRDAMLLFNNILLLVMTVTVLLGTLYPLILDSLDLGRISVGPPYFNALIVPLTVALGLFMGAGPVARWKQMNARELIRRLWLSAIVSLVFALSIPWLYDGAWSLPVSLGLLVAAWIVIPLAREPLTLIRRFGLRGPGKLSRSHYGMVLGHIGMAVTIVGVTMVSNYDHADNVRMSPGRSVEVGGYSFTMTQLNETRGPNYVSDRATIRVTQGDRLVTLLHPEKRFFTTRRQAMTETALDNGLTRDLYVAMGEALDDGESWAMRIQVKPFVRWLWLGALLMAAGGILAVCDKRYRHRSRTRQTMEART
ncbi:cytochrome c-type biogenesis protein CcmF [Kushneria pakistanensis]|uniref:Cytochrome c-type biogenesis protein CcmF n=1 Tax=Kushneria pakistanensis TaxID=1508770 RepID=A0ABQ3FIH8_9GAMM|nr:heme lyase CcmF/NrfE family subunit [Kushneria pakistanensis]GHC25883.1 cytochrome c-type biogenesis protein CcmF [Kushneria pakistanensis]